MEDGRIWIHVITMKSDLAIARETVMAPIAEIAAAAGFLENELEPYGRYKAKITEYMNGIFKGEILS